MDDWEGARAPSRRRKLALVGGVILVLALGVWVITSSTRDPPASLTVDPAGLTGVPAGQPTPGPTVGLGQTAGTRLAGEWSTSESIPDGAGVPAGQSVWTGRELLVGFSPRVAAYSPDRRPGQRWRVLPPHPAQPLRVRGVTQARGAEVFVFGVQSCAGCPWDGQLWTVEPNTGEWTRLADAPTRDGIQRESVVMLGNQVAVIRDLGSGGLQVIAFDPLVQQWRDLSAPSDGRFDWQVVSAGTRMVLAGERTLDNGILTTQVLVYDLTREEWESVAQPMPMRAPQRAAAVWAGDRVIYFGGSTRDSVQGVELDLRLLRWTVLPQAPALDASRPISGPDRGALSGLAGVWDGDRAVFLGGLNNPIQVAWSPTTSQWQLRRPPPSRVNGMAWWTGGQILLWGGVDRDGPAADLLSWPAGAGNLSGG
ncbi:MAG: hypothetical protein ACR2HR_13180 [Euzebya sp.]